jgi:competence protein ComEC
MSGLLSVVAGLSSGVVLRSFFNLGWEWVVFLLFVSAFAGGAFFLQERNGYKLIALFCLLFAMGILRTAVAYSPPAEKFENALGERVSYTATVVADPDVRDTNQRIELLIKQGEDATGMLAIAPRYPKIEVGDRVHVSGTLARPEPFAEANGKLFRYDNYLARDGIRYLLNFASLRVEASAPWYSLPASLAKSKHAFLDGLSSALPEPYASLAGGIVIGGKSGLGNELQNSFVRSGLVQIIVLSGYNVMVVAEWIMAAFALTRLSRKWATGAGIAAVVLFVGIAGASATALRAMVMALIALYARATTRSYSAGRALFAAVFLMLIWNPLYLAFDPGFGLSIAATAGLIWLAPLLEQQFTWLKSVFWKSAVATTCAAQIAVLPLLLYDTGMFSLVSIPANLLVLPVVPLSMGVSALAGVVGMISQATVPFMSILFGLPAYFTNAYLIFIAMKMAAVPFSTLAIPVFPFWVVVLVYAVLIYVLASKRFSGIAQFTFSKKAST